MNKIAYIFVGVCVLILVIVAFNPFGTPDKPKTETPPRELTKEEKEALVAKERTETIEKGFSSWDGSHIKLTEIIKEHMNDEKSYEHVKTLYWDNGDYITVKATFRGANAFGAKVLSTVTAKCSFDGDVLEVIEQE